MLNTKGPGFSNSGGNRTRSNANTLPPMAIKIGNDRALNNSSSAQKSSRISCVAKPYAKNNSRNAAPISRDWIIHYLIKTIGYENIVEITLHFGGSRAGA